MTFRGVYTALITPFNKDGSVDEKAMRELVEFQISEGVSGLVPMGSTGESPTLNHEEHGKVIEIVINQVAGRIPVIAGTGSNCTAEAIRITKQAAEAGADASLQVSPYYVKPTQEGFYRHFAAIADAVDIPLIVYNIPGRSGENISAKTQLKLAEHPNICAAKEASGSLPQMMDIIQNAPTDFNVLSGDDNIAVPLVLMGGKGLISVASNAIPSQMVKMIHLALSDDADAARKEHYRLLPFFRSLFVKTNPIPIKYVMSKLGKALETYRLPLCSLTDESRKIVDDAMAKCNIQ